MKMWRYSLICLFILFVSGQVSAAPAPTQVVDEALDTSDAKIVRLEVRFNLPVDFLWQYPKTKKNIFFIALQPLVGDAQYALDARQKVLVPPSLRNVVQNLHYDGTEPSARFLVLETYKAVNISIKAEAKTNRLTIEFSGIHPQTKEIKKKKKEGTSSGNQ